MALRVSGRALLWGQVGSGKLAEVLEDQGLPEDGTEGDGGKGDRRKTELQGALLIGCGH